MVATIFRYRDAGEFQVHEYVVMPNHIHLLLTPGPGTTIAQAMQLIKGGFSRALGESGTVLKEVWQARYHDRRVRDIEEYVHFAYYIRENPVRKGLVNVASEFPYSSAEATLRLDEVPGPKPLVQEENASTLA